MIEPQPAVQPQPSNATGTAPGKKRRFGGTGAQILSALKFYEVLAYLTGSMLLLLCAELITRYGFGQYLFAVGLHRCEFAYPGPEYGPAPASQGAAGRRRKVRWEGDYSHCIPDVPQARPGC
jgi:hypothetical protein